MSSEKALGAPLGTPLRMKEPFAGNIGWCTIVDRTLEVKELQ